MLALTYLLGQDMAEEGDLVPDRVLNGFLAPADDDVRRDAETTKFSNAGLIRNTKVYNSVLNCSFDRPIVQLVFAF